MDDKCAATNAPETLEPALKRPGRLDRIVKAGVPALEGRKMIQYYSNNTTEWKHITCLQEKGLLFDGLLILKR